MKLNTNSYGLVYLNRGKFTRQVYHGNLYGTVTKARNYANNVSRTVRKNLKVARLVLETV